MMLVIRTLQTFYSLIFSKKWAIIFGEEAEYLNKIFLFRGGNVGGGVDVGGVEDVTTW